MYHPNPFRNGYGIPGPFDPHFGGLIPGSPFHPHHLTAHPMYHHSLYRTHDLILEILRQQNASGPMHEPDRAPPAKPYIIEELPLIKLEKVDLDDPANQSCSVCLETFKIGDEAKRMPCSHFYCDDCLADWLLKNCTCPMCRYELPTDNPAYEAKRKQRMRNRNPRFRRHELDRLSISQLKCLLHRLDNYRALEKVDLIEHLISSKSIELIPQTDKHLHDADIGKGSHKTIGAIQRHELEKLSIKDLTKMLPSGDTYRPVEKKDLIDHLLQQKSAAVAPGSTSPIVDRKSLTVMVETVYSDNESEAAIDEDAIELFPRDLDHARESGPDSASNTTKVGTTNPDQLLEASSKTSQKSDGTTAEAINTISAPPTSERSKAPDLRHSEPSFSPLMPGLSESDYWKPSAQLLRPFRQANVSASSLLHQIDSESGVREMLCLLKATDRSQVLLLTEKQSPSTALACLAFQNRQRPIDFGESRGKGTAVMFDHFIENSPRKCPLLLAFSPNPDGQGFNVNRYVGSTREEAPIADWIAGILLAHSMDRRNQEPRTTHQRQLPALHKLAHPVDTDVQFRAMLDRGCTKQGAILLLSNPLAEKHDELVQIGKLSDCLANRYGHRLVDIGVSRKLTPALRNMLFRDGNVELCKFPQVSFYVRTPTGFNVEHYDEGLEAAPVCRWIENILSTCNRP